MSFSVEKIKKDIIFCEDSTRSLFQFRDLEQFSFENLLDFIDSAVKCGKFSIAFNIIEHCKFKNYDINSKIVNIFLNNIKSCVSAPKNSYTENGNKRNYTVLTNENRIGFSLWLLRYYPVIFDSIRFYDLIKIMNENKAWDMFYNLLPLCFCFNGGSFNDSYPMFIFNISEMESVFKNHYFVYKELFEMLKDNSISNECLIDYIKENRGYFHTSPNSNTRFYLFAKIVSFLNESSIDRYDFFKYVFEKVEYINECSRYRGFEEKPIELMKNYHGSRRKDLFKLIFEKCDMNPLADEDIYNCFIERQDNDFIDAACEFTRDNKKDFCFEKNTPFVSSVVFRNAYAFESLLKNGFGNGLYVISNTSIFYKETVSAVWRMIDLLKYNEFYFIAAKYGYYRIQKSENIVRNCLQCKKSNIDFLNLFSRLKNKEITLSEAIEEYDYTLYKNVSEDFNKCYGECIGHFVVSYGTAEDLKILIESGYDIEKVNRLGFSALYFAIVLDKQDMVKILIESGANTKKKYINRFPFINDSKIDLITLAITHLSKKVLNYFCTLQQLFSVNQEKYRDIAVLSRDSEMLKF